MNRSVLDGVTEPVIIDTDTHFTEPRDLWTSRLPKKWADQTLNVPVLSAGTYYILAHSVSGDAATAGFTLTVQQITGLKVSAISTYAGGNHGSTTIEIDGTNFSTGTTAKLTLGTTTINDSAIYFVSPSQIYATFPLQNQALGSYTLSAQDGTQSATAARR